MRNPNTIELEIDAIRDKIYQETKHMTREEQSKRLNEITQKLAAEFGFKIGTPKDREALQKAI